MNRVQRVAFRFAGVAAIVLCFGVSAIRAQTDMQAPASSAAAPEASKAPGMRMRIHLRRERQPPPLPPGMSRVGRKRSALQADAGAV